ncbi:hypothetical protein ABB37_08020 [Leptomonas pyrrhocoris]|uniref:Uncharacterized protein n=1 Tax=Leptomonas pyrrhocoris TaxID=157538 RepID=A0A0N0DSM4_LEPPY|nr:hypothetical protein ABB37_08020 [Leptomonas pyrrhocoris]KPA76292.1 hypothetical protein ABB37_08020 [Leptomonas pyrrhocoris]|eukprot:XP_015654731.1 hypothetical protein ABB37_08020 [Leptomonas pyrrhocoris]
MSLQAFFDFSSSVVDPKYVGLTPFFAPRQERLDTRPPAILASMYEYTMCTKRALNTRIIGFAEPTLQQCIEAFSRNVKASAMIGDAEAQAAVLRQRRGVVDPYALPWAPKPEYVEWLRGQGRLDDSTQGNNEGR